MSRTFFVRLNVDDMCADLDTMRPDQHAEWIAGFRAGCRGRIPPGWDGARLQGAVFGLTCWEEAEGYRAKQSDKGKRSAQVRAERSGTADPRANREPDVNHGSTTVRTGREPDVNPSNIQHLTSNIQQPAASAPPTEPGLFDPCHFAAGQPLSAPHMAACDAKFLSGGLLSDLKRSMCKLTKQNGNLPEWRAMVDEHGWQVVSDAAKKVRPDERWPDRVAGAIWDKDKCPHQPGTDLALNWHALHMECK